MAVAEHDLDFLSSIVAERTGNVISPHQAYLVESRLAPVAKEAGLSDIHALVQELQRTRNSPVHDRVAEAMTINETSFFRDPGLFDAITARVIPELIDARKSQRTLRIWCAACSSGQEPYTLAILLRSRFPELGNWDVKITATDYSQEILSKAKSGSYSQFEVGRGLPAAMLVLNFDRVGMDWVVKPEIRKQIEFRELNLLAPFPFYQPFDLVLLRNVLIYFDPEKKVEILTSIHRTLASDGYLFLGGGESLVSLETPFERQVLDGAVGYRPL